MLKPGLKLFSFWRTRWDCGERNWKHYGALEPSCLSVNSVATVTMALTSSRAVSASAVIAYESATLSAQVEGAGAAVSVAEMVHQSMAQAWPGIEYGVRVGSVGAASNAGSSLVSGGSCAGSAGGAVMSSGSAAGCRCSSSACDGSCAALPVAQ